MPDGIKIKREFVVLLEDGTAMLDWEVGTGIDLLKNEFISYDARRFCQPIRDADLEILKRAGRVISYNDHEVVFSSLPEAPHKK